MAERDYQVSFGENASREAIGVQVPGRRITCLNARRCHKMRHRKAYSWVKC